MVFRLFLCIVATSALTLVTFTGVSHAAEFTDLLDAADDFDDFDEDNYKAFDFHIEPSFRFETGTATISREAPCVPRNDPSLENELVESNPRLIVDTGRCKEAGIVYNKEMAYKAVQSSMDVTLRAGLYKDLELHITVPYVFSSTRGLKYSNDDPRADKNVDASNSSVDPDNDRVTSEANRAFNSQDGSANTFRNLDQFNTYRFFELEDDFTTFERSGFADPSLGIHWAPFNDHRDDTKATLLIGMDYVMPLAPIARHDNSAVGKGMHELQWKLASSKKFNWVEPYFGLQYFLPLPATDSPVGKVDSNNIGQVITNAPHRGLITIGTEFIPHEDAETGARYAIDLRFQFGYTSEGRDYTPMFDHFTNSHCNGKTVEEVLPQFDGAGQLTNPDDVACAWIVRQPSNAKPVPVYDIAEAYPGDDSPYIMDGIMTVEGYATFSGQLGFYLQPTRYFQFRAVGGLTHKQEHFLTNSRTGKNSDQTEDDTVALTGPEAALERNPVYNPTYDSPGSRFRVQEYNTWHIMFTTALQF